MNPRHAAALALVMLALIVTIAIPTMGLAGPSFVVLDKHSQHVGVFTNLSGDGSVIREINGFWFFLPVDTTGFTSLPQPPQTYYTSTNCMGQAYLMIFPGPLPLVREGTIFNTILIYGDLTKAETLTVNSTLSIDCIPLSNPQTFLVVPPVEYDLSNLKLVPSFKLVKQP